MKKIAGVILILVGIFVGLYVGLWLMFIGGIVQLINQLQAPHIEALQVSYGVVKIMLASFIGWICAIACFIPGFTLLL
jgi:hypothetical protein